LAASPKKLVLPYKLLYAGFCLLLVWNLAIIGAPYLVNSHNKIFQYLGSAVYFFMDPVCHQLPDRSLFIAALPMPVCARCFFIYLAGLFVVGWPLFTKRFSCWPRFVYIILGIFVGLDILSEKLQLFENWFELRMLSGFVLGALIFRLILEGVVVGSRKKIDE